MVATDQGVSPQSASASVIITVQDINDNDPVFEPKVYEAMVAEDDPPGEFLTKFFNFFVKNVQAFLNQKHLNVF